MIKLLSLIIIIISSSAIAKSIDEMIEGKKRGVLLITIYNKETQKQIENGTGFFTDNKGHFITNNHVLKTFLDDMKKYQLRLQLNNGSDFSEIEIIKCGNNNKIDLCYGKINSKNKIYFFDVLSKSPIKTQQVAGIGQNPTFFGVKKGEVARLTSNIDEQYGTSLNDNKNVSLVEISKYESAEKSCKSFRGDSGGPVFDQLTGDLVGVFTECISSRKTGDVFKFAIDTKEVSAFISDSLSSKPLKLPKDSIYQEPPKKEIEPDIGHEFDNELRTGKLE